MPTKAEENYLKAIIKIADRDKHSVSTNAVAKEMQTSAASVTDMLKRLSEKQLVHYEKYKGVNLTESGRRLATGLIRKHRLWEVFLLEHLNFQWDEVHDIAEELEHIDSEELVNRLDAFLGNPKFDPHGDPIPSVDGKFTLRFQLPLTQLESAQKAMVVGVREHTPHFLKHLDDLGVAIGTPLTLLERFGYDDSLKVMLNGKAVILSAKVGHNILVKPERKP